MKFVAWAIVAMLTTLNACSVRDSPNQNVARADPGNGELSAEPGAVGGSSNTPLGLHKVASAGSKPALLYVPPSYASNKPMPLVVMLHGAGGTARHSMDLVRRNADRLGFIVLAPASHAYSWDIIAGRSYGPDVGGIDELLGRLFQEYSIDRERLAIAGFSDGASYALSLGLANGRLFSHAIAFSPGFMAPSRQQGSPKVFISHGVQDQVLPIERCSRRIVQQLKAARYEVNYQEFPSGHTVPEELNDRAFEALMGYGN